MSIFVVRRHSFLFLVILARYLRLEHRRKLTLLQRDIVAKIGESLEYESDFSGWFSALQMHSLTSNTSLPATHRMPPFKATETIGPPATNSPTDR